MKEPRRGYGLILEPADLSLGRARAEAKGDTEGSSLPPAPSLSPFSAKITLPSAGIRGLWPCGPQGYTAGRFGAVLPFLLPHWFCDGNQGGVPLTPLTACVCTFTRPNQSVSEG